MKKHLIRVILTLTCLLLFPALLTYADGNRLLTPADNAPAAWLSARKGDAAYTHDLRVVLVLPADWDSEKLSVALTFDGTTPPNALQMPVPKLPLYRTVKAGGSSYSAAEGATIRVMTVEGLADGSYSSLTLTLSDGGKMVHRSTQSAAAIGAAADLTLLPWDSSLTDWMGALPDSRSIADLTIPGTHDSGADYNNGLTTTYSRCQSLSIADQLSAGVRFMDIRLKLQDSGLNVYHGIVDQHLTFDEVLADCKAFLSAHPGEVILMSIKQEDDDNASFPSAIAAEIAKDPTLWYTQNRIPTLGEARGKILLIRRYGGASIGINCADGWSDNTQFTMHNGVSMQVQDYYNLGSSDNLESKWSKLQTLITTASKQDNTFCLNFSSGYTSGLFGLPSISTVSNYMNPKLTDYFAALPRGGYGTFAIDFITPEIAAELIATNFPD